VAAATRQARQVGFLDAIWIDQDEPADTEAREVLDEQHADPAHADHADAKVAEDGLPTIAEQASLPVVHGVGDRWRSRPGPVDLPSDPEDRELIDLRPRAIGRPDLPGSGLGGEHESADRPAAEQVQQGWVAALVGAEIVIREADAIPPAMRVGGQVGELGSGRLQGGLGHERRGEPVMAAVARAGEVVDAVNRPDHLADEQARPAATSSDPGEQDRRVGSAVAREEVACQFSELPRRDPDRPGAGYLRFSHASTRSSFRSAVSVAGSRWLLRRESWIEGRPSNELDEVPEPRAAPSERARSPRTWNG
jgi:hypothetical protein